MRLTALVLASLVTVSFGAWGAIALWFQAPGGSAGRWAAALAWGLLAAVAVACLWRGPALWAAAGFALLGAALLWWWHGLEPSNSRAWADDVARTASGEVQGDTLVLDGVRNFDWRSNEDYTARWERHSYDLRELRSLDMITSYWEGPAIAHVLFSFGFTDGRYLCFSVEIRRERGEQFNEIGGFFKEFELSIIAAEERDIIRVRTNVRGEDDYLYHVRLPLADIRALLLAYVRQLNELAHAPRFYNTISVNCTTLIYHMMQHIVGRLPFSYQVLLPGYLPEYVYRVGGLDQRYPLAELRRLGRITERARAADRSAGFSQDIRAGIPPLPPEDPAH